MLVVERHLHSFLDAFMGARRKLTVTVILMLLLLRKVFANALFGWSCFFWFMMCTEMFDQVYWMLLTSTLIKECKAYVLFTNILQGRLNLGYMRLCKNKKTQRWLEVVEGSTFSFKPRKKRNTSQAISKGQTPVYVILCDVHGRLPENSK